MYLIAGGLTAPFATGLLGRPLPAAALLAVAAMAVFPSALGHTLYNAALRRVHASLPNLIATQEVTEESCWPGCSWGAPHLEQRPRAGVTLLGVALTLR